MDKLCFTIMLNAMKQSVVRTPEALTRNGSFWFLVERNKDGSRLINEPGFFFFSLEVFKRKTDFSAEHRMSTLGITSNLSESKLGEQKNLSSQHESS